MKRIEKWVLQGCKFLFSADPTKNVKAFGKHGVTLRKASEIFLKGRTRLERADYKPNHSESRRVATGLVRGREGLGAVTVAFTKHGNNIRMITAQPASNLEKNALRFALRIAKNKHLLRGEIKKDLGRQPSRQPSKKVYKTDRSAVRTMRQQGKKYSDYARKGADAAQSQKNPAVRKTMDELKREHEKRWAAKAKEMAERMRAGAGRDFRTSQGRDGAKPYRTVNADSPWKEKNREP